MVPPDSKVLAKKGSKSVHKIVSSNEKACLTTLFTASASGKLLPLMLLFGLKTAPKKTILNEIPRDWRVGNSEIGWMTSETFYKFITNVFYKYLVENSYEFPVILFADGHSSH